MKYIGHTLFNDERYGGDQILKGTTFSKYKQFVQNCFDICPDRHCTPRHSALNIPSQEKRCFSTRLFLRI